jgi:dTDP-4-dehydrorhamnose 3,5-epimerase
MCVISGMAKVVLWDGRGSKSPTDNLINEFVVGEHNLKLIHIPSFVYHGIKCISEKECLVLNIINNPYDHSGPDEFRANPHDSIVPYKWERKDG